MATLYNRVKVATATTGTGTITLGAGVRSSTLGDFLSFAEAGVPDATVVPYFIQDGANFAYGQGTYTASGTTLSRDASEVRWNGSALSTAALSLSGVAVVFIGARAADLAALVTGPASATDNAIVRYDAATGKLLQDSAASIDDSGNITAPGYVKLASIADPAAPSGGILLYSKQIAGRHMPKMIGPSGIDTVLQTGLHGNSVFIFGPASGTITPTAIGGTLTTSATMSMQLTIASANPWLATQRKRFQTAATAGAVTGCRTAYVQWFRGNAAGFGGFFFRAQFGQNLNVNGAQCFVGLCASTGALATTAGAVSALLNMIGVGFDTTDANTGNWQLFRNDGTGTATKVDLGADAARGTTHGYDLIIFCPPGAATEIWVRIVNLHSGVTVLDTSYTTDLPAVNTGMAFKAECNNGAVASAHNLELAKVYIESDY